MDVDKTELLARKLNIVERLVIPSSTGSSGNGQRNFGGPRHLIALKFQSSSAKRRESSSSGFKEEVEIEEGNDEMEKDEEIIDFAAVVVSLETESIVAAFHQYVMPTEKPTLSSTCQKSTGVSQEAVDNGVPLKTCLMLYANWLTKLEKDVGLMFSSKQHRNNPVTIPVTWSNWDLGECLPNEAKRKRLVYAKHLSGWVDLRAASIEHLKQVPSSLRDAVTRSKLIWKEKESLALESATNIASLALAMHENGLSFKHHINSSN